MTPPDAGVSGPAFLSSVLGFGRELKREGLTADLAAVLDFVRALDLVDIGDREEVRAAGAALFIRRKDELEPYERAFERFWRGRAMAPAGLPQLSSDRGDVDPQAQPSRDSDPGDAQVVATGVVRDTQSVESGDADEEESTPS